MTSTTATIRLATGFSNSSPFHDEGLSSSLDNTALPHWVEVAVIGSGFAGLGAAIELGVRKHSVLVVEAATVGSDPFASGLGFLHESLPESALLPNDEALARQVSAAASDAHRWTGRVINELAIECDLDLDAMPNTVDPFAYYSGLLGVAIAQGVTIRQDTRALSLHPLRGGGFEIHTTAGRFRAGQVVVADPTLLNVLAPKTPVTLKPQQWVYLVTESIGANVPTTSDPGLRELEGRRLLAGAAVSGVFADARDELGARLLGSQPSLQSASGDGNEVRITNAWQATFLLSTDGIPHAGEHGGVYYIVPGAETDLARMAWLGSRTARWMTGEPKPVLCDLPPLRKLALAGRAIKTKIGR